ncbi:ATP-binding protein [Vulgatibacter sp.]|uniref:ATP-binding protein n=1 Tax=Vulgatibacter sp. TaxID=1971226 RepID=UPI00356B4EFC
MTVDLEACAREPIRIPGAIQPHGLLLVADTSGRLLQASANTGEWLGETPEALHGRELHELLGPGFDAILATPDKPFSVVLRGRQVEAVAHRADGRLLLEIEAAVGHADPLEGFLDVCAAVERFTGEGLDTLLAEVATEVRRITGFDRVMIYRFDPAWNGEVVAESLREGVESYFGLHYPASDIPAQARELYATTWIRLIPDADAAPVPLVPLLDPESGLPRDLSRAALRSVSPVHLQYLRNMGVGASMSISLLPGGKLWGLVACHHLGPRRVPLQVRAACELLGRIVSGEIVGRQREESAVLRLRQRSAQAALVERIGAAEDPLGALAADPALLATVEADGAAILEEGRVLRTGEVPPGAVLDAIHRWLCALPAEDLQRTDRLPSLLPAAAPHADTASGLLAMPLTSARESWLVFFRGERLRTVTWGGDPNKPAVDELTPRHSFAAWKETARGTSLPWGSEAIEGAVALRSALVEIVFRHAAAVRRLNEALARSNEELDAFAAMASHDLQEPLRGIRQAAAILQDDLGAHLGADRRWLDTIQRLADKSQAMLVDLFEYARVGRIDLAVRDVDLQVLVEDVIDLLHGRLVQSAVEIRLPAPLPVVRCDEVRVRQLFVNLLSNAIKYADKPVPWVEIGCVGGAPPAFYVKDNGIGILPEEQASIFEMFRRLHPPGAYGGGSGAGLAIAARIVERHGGRIWIDSKPGAGSTFYFTLAPPAD